MSRVLKTSRALVIDLELTCWDGPPPPGMRPEIIEIGIVEVDMQTRSFPREASYLVKPVTSEISDYCTSLTGITADEVARDGRPFAEVLRTLAGVFGPAKKSLITWGGDWEAIDDACGEHSVGNPFPPGSVLNLGQLVSLAAGQDRRIGLHEALESAGLEQVGTRHRGLVDARSTGMALFAVSDALSPLFPSKAAHDKSMR